MSPVAPPRALGRHTAAAIVCARGHRASALTPRRSGAGRWGGAGGGAGVRGVEPVLVRGVWPAGGGAVTGDGGWRRTPMRATGHHWWRSPSAVEGWSSSRTVEGWWCPMQGRARQGKQLRSRSTRWERNPDIGTARCRAHGTEQGRERAEKTKLFTLPSVQLTRGRTAPPAAAADAPPPLPPLPPPRGRQQLRRHPPPPAVRSAASARARVVPSAAPPGGRRRRAAGSGVATATAAVRRARWGRRRRHTQRPTHGGPPAAGRATAAAGGRQAARAAAVGRRPTFKVLLAPPLALPAAAAASPRVATATADRGTHISHQYYQRVLTTSQFPMSNDVNSACSFGAHPMSNHSHQPLAPTTRTGEAHQSFVHPAVLSAAAAASASLGVKPTASRRLVSRRMAGEEV